MKLYLFFAQKEAEAIISNIEELVLSLPPGFTKTINVLIDSTEGLRQSPRRITKEDAMTTLVQIGSLLNCIKDETVNRIADIYESTFDIFADKLKQSKTNYA